MLPRIVDSAAWGVGATIGALVSGILALTVWLFVSPSAIARANNGALLSSSADDAGHVATAVLLAMRAADTTPVLLAVGASSMREAFPDEDVVTRELSAAVGRRVRFVLLAASSQTLLESLGIIASHPLPRGSSVLLQIDPERLRVSVADVRAFRTQDRIPFLDDTRVNDWLHDSGLAGRDGWAPLRRRQWFAMLFRARLLPLPTRCVQSVRHGWFASGCADILRRGPWFSPPPTYVAHAYSDTSLPSHAKDSLALSAWSRRLINTPTSMNIGSAILETLTRRISANGSRLFLSILPADSRVRRAERADELELSTAIASANKAGASVVNLRKLLVLPDTSFYDLHHVRPFVRGTILSAVVQAVAAPAPD